MAQEHTLEIPVTNFAGMTAGDQIMVLIDGDLYGAQLTHREYNQHFDREALVFQCLDIDALETQEAQDAEVTLSEQDLKELELLRQRRQHRNPPSNENPAPS